MSLKGFTRNFKPLEILTEEQVEAIHRGTLDVLQETGVTIQHERALKLLEKNGCKIDYDEMRARIPPSLVEECLAKCPSSFRIKARDSKNDIVLGGNTVHFMNGPGMQTIDLDTWEPRTPTRKELYDLVTVLDALPTVTFLCCYPYFGYAGVPPIMAIPEETAARIRNSTKALYTAGVNDANIFTIKMAQAVGTEIVGQCTMAPPLAFVEDQVDSVFTGTEAGSAMGVVSGCIYGGTGPATIAGSIVSDNVETIAGTVLIQLIRPGTRVMTIDQTNPQDMHRGSPCFDNIGSALHMVGATQVWRKYKIPHVFAAAGYTNSKRPDIQSGYERAFHTLLQVLSGASLVILHGGIYAEHSAHPVMAVLDDDIAGMVGRFIEGVEVNDETLAIDLINEVGPVPGFYLDKEHTRKWWKSERFMPKAADGLTYPEWMKTGKKSALDYAKERMDEILATHKVDPPLTAKQEQDVEDILKEAREYYRKKGLISDEEWAVYMKSLKSPNYPYE